MPDGQSDRLKARFWRAASWLTILIPVAAWIGLMTVCVIGAWASGPIGGVAVLCLAVLGTTVVAGAIFG